MDSKPEKKKLTAKDKKGCFLLLGVIVVVVIVIAALSGGGGKADSDLGRALYGEINADQHAVLNAAKHEANVSTELYTEKGDNAIDIAHSYYGKSGKQSCTERIRVLKSGDGTQLRVSNDVSDSVESAGLNQGFYESIEAHFK